MPGQFEIGRHTFFDFGPPHDFYEIFLVRPGENGTPVERITLTPAGDACFQTAKAEVVSASINEPVESLLGEHNPCSIPEKALLRERKRCKKCLVFSFANISMQVQCGNQTRIIRADILDRDWFDPSANTPEHTPWTMQLLERLDRATGPGVMERPVFPIANGHETSEVPAKSESLASLASGEYDTLFQGAPDKPSDLYRASQVQPPAPTVQLISSTPFQPEVFIQPGYPPIARVAHVEGPVTFTIEIDPNGNATDPVFESAHPFFRETVKEAVAKWKFSREATGQKIRVTLDFRTNCPSPKR